MIQLDIAAKMRDDMAYIKDLELMARRSAVNGGALRAVSVLEGLHSALILPADENEYWCLPAPLNEAAECYRRWLHAARSAEQTGDALTTAPVLAELHKELAAIKLAPEDSAASPEWPCGPADADRAARHISAERLIADMAAVNARCERGLQELAAIQTELAMIRRDMATLHGISAAPADT